MIQSKKSKIDLPKKASVLLQQSTDVEKYYELLNKFPKNEIFPVHADVLHPRADYDTLKPGSYFTKHLY